jgi:Xaa-Pro aminopeptidase
LKTELHALQERNGANYDFGMMLETRERTRGVIRDVAARIIPGMAEEDALALMRQTLKERNMLRGWHGIHVRFGQNTLKTFGKPSEPGVVLRENDIFFIDIGPVWRGYEGDGGETFTVGSDPEMLKAATDVKAVFDLSRDAWASEGLSGADLYRFAQQASAARGWELNLDRSGHRLSDFPHAVKFEGTLLDAPYTPSAGLWVLEIQIRHPDKPFSAFYEDLLL